MNRSERRIERKRPMDAIGPFGVRAAGAGGAAGELPASADRNPSWLRRSAVPPDEGDQILVAGPTQARARRCVCIGVHSADTSSAPLSAPVATADCVRDVETPRSIYRSIPHQVHRSLPMRFRIAITLGALANG